MQIIVDPDYWYRRQDLSSTSVCNPDGDTADLIDVLDSSSIREIRNDADRGEITDRYVTRDFNTFASNWEAIVARATVDRAPRITQYYDEFTNVLSNLRFRPRFEDIEVYKDKITAESEYSTPVRVNALDLIIAGRLGRYQLPHPNLVEHEPKFVAECLDLEVASGLRKAVLRDLFSNDDFLVALEESGTEANEYGAWANHLRLVKDGEAQQSGELALVYAKADSDEQQEWESFAILSHALERSKLLVGTKLEKAKNELSMSTQFTELDPIFQDLLVEIASKESYKDAQELASEKGALRSMDAMDISENDIRRYIKESRPELLTKDVINNLDQIPLSLFSTAPNEVQVVIDTLKPSKVVNDLDVAIANGESQLDKLLSKIKEIIDLIEPVAPAQAKSVQSTLDHASEMIEALNPTKPDHPKDCIQLYDEHLKREASLSTKFGATERKIADSILAVCEDYIRDTYRQWANTNPESREVAMITDIPTRVERLLDDNNHILIIISDGFGLRQWLEAIHDNDKIAQWFENDVITNTPMTTIFPSETGSGHYSLFTGQYPIDHERDDIEKSISPTEGHIFDRASKGGAYTQALSYHHSSSGGFSEVLERTADNFETLEGLLAEDAAFQKETVNHIADVVDQHEKSVHLLQHNQIDHLHGSTEHIADSLISVVADDLATFIKQLSQRLGGRILPILTADHGMIRTDNTRKSLAYGEGKDALKSMGESFDQLGQRVVGLNDKNKQGQSFQKTENKWFEVLSKKTMRELRAQTKDKCDGRTLRFKRRYYSESENMTATHGAFTFDEIFIPFVEFNTKPISEEISK